MTSPKNPSEQPAPAEAPETVAYEHDFGTFNKLSYKNEVEGSFGTRELVYKLDAAPAEAGSAPLADMLLVPRWLVVDAESKIAEEWGDDTETGKALNAILHGRAP